MTMAIITQNLFEAVGEDCDFLTKVYLRHMEESFVKPYLVWRSQQVLTEAEIDASVLNKMKSGLYAQKPKGKINPKAVTQVLPPSKMKDFADALPAAEESKPVPGFKEKAMKAISGLKDTASKQSMMELIRTGISNPAVQQTIIAGITGAAAVGMANLGVPPAVTGGILGGLIGIVKAKAQGGSWKDAAKSGIKQGLAGAAAGAVSGWAAGAASTASSNTVDNVFRGAVSKVEDFTDTVSDDKTNDFAFNPEKTPGAPEGGFTKDEPITAGPSVDYSSMSAKEIVDQIYADNKYVIGRNPNLIKPGQTFELPNGEDYTVKKDDNLWKIAKMLKAGSLEESMQSQRIDEVSSEQFYDEAKARGYTDAQIKAIFDKFKIELPTTMPSGIVSGTPQKQKASGETSFNTGNLELDKELAVMMAAQGKDAVVAMLKNARAALSKAQAASDPYEVYKGELRKMADQKGGKPLPAGIATKFRTELIGDLNKMKAGDKDSGAYAAQKILKYAKAGYDVGSDAEKWLAIARVGERSLTKEEYSEVSDILESYGLSWKDIGLQVRLVEYIEDTIMISRIN
jgi:hypothetical protein